MSLGRNLLYSLLAETNDRASAERRIMAALRAGVADHSFEDEDDRKVWEFINDHYIRYRTIPSVDVVEVETDTRFPDYIPEEPFDFWLDQIKLYNKHVYLVDGVEKVLKHLEAGRTLHAADMVGS